MPTPEDPKTPAVEDLQLHGEFEGLREGPSVEPSPRADRATPMKVTVLSAEQTVAKDAVIFHTIDFTSKPPSIEILCLTVVSVITAHIARKDHSEQFFWLVFPKPRIEIVIVFTEYLLTRIFSREARCDTCIHHLHSPDHWQSLHLVSPMRRRSGAKASQYCS